MHRRTLLIIAIATVIIVVVAVGAFTLPSNQLPKDTYLEVSPAGIAVESGNNVTLTATLFSGQTELKGRTIAWSTTSGSLDAKSGMTVTFTAPNVTASEQVDITASFAGQGIYRPNSTIVRLTVAPVEATVTALKISPSVFEASSGGTLVFNATLTDPSDGVLTGKTITWSVSPSGTRSLSSTTGSSVTYTAPVVSGNTTVTIVASFAGDGQYTASSDSSQGNVFAPGQPLEQPTRVLVSPSTFSVQSNESQVLNATVVDSSGNVLVGKTITWSINPSGTGSLSSTTGASVTYTAPVVSGNTTVTIVASFAGDGQYTASSDSSQGIVLPHVGVRMPTFLSVSPTEFTIYSNETQVLNATLTDASGNILVGKTITWGLVFGCPTCGYGIGGGNLSSTVGTSVIYTAPSFASNFELEVKATFAGDYYYQGSYNSSLGSVFPPVGVKGSSFLKISPSTFTTHSNQTQALNATLTDASGNFPMGKTITWSVSPSGTGSLSSTTGASVTYTAPTVQSNTSVTISASFAGDDFYTGSSDNVTGTIMPVTGLSSLYKITFAGATLTNVTFQGPVVVDGTSVTNITCDLADVSGFTLSHMGLNSSTVAMSYIELDVTYFKAYSSDTGSMVEMTGDQAVSLGPMGSANYAGGMMYLVRMSGSQMNLSRMVAMGEGANGSEPYVPSIMLSQTVTLIDVYDISGPVTYGGPAVQVSNITAGTVTMSAFSFVHPVAYSLDRASHLYSYTDRWVLNASTATASNVSVYSIYLRTMVHGIYPVTATGNEDIAAMIPHVLYGGCSLVATSLEQHAVYFSADQLTLGSFTLSIE